MTDEGIIRIVVTSKLQTLTPKVTRRSCGVIRQRVRWQRDRNPNQTQKRVDKGGGCREVSGPRGPQTALNSPKTSFAKKVVRVVVPHKTI